MPFLVMVSSPGKTARRAATLAAFIGAGGLGDPIVTGLALNDSTLILQGAVPAACLAILTEMMFTALERRLVVPHMRNGNRNT